MVAETITETTKMTDMGRKKWPVERTQLRFQ
jgi:hypothetical protein